MTCKSFSISLSKLRAWHSSKSDGVMVVPSNFDPRGDGYLRDRMELAKHSGREVTREFLEDIVGNGRL